MQVLKNEFVRVHSQEMVVEGGGGGGDGFPRVLGELLPKTGGAEGEGEGTVKKEGDEKERGFYCLNN